MAGGGWIKLYRSFLESPFYTDLTAKAVYVHLKLTAAYEPRQVHGIELQPGQAITTIARLAAELQITPAKVRRSLNVIQKNGNITIKTTNKFTVITIVNTGVDEKTKDDDSKQNETQKANKKANLPIIERNLKQSKKNNNHHRDDDVTANNSKLMQDKDFVMVFNAMNENGFTISKNADKEKLAGLVAEYGTEHVISCIEKMKEYNPKRGYVKYLSGVCETN